MLSDGRRAAAACPNHPETRKFLRDWIDACAYVGGDVLFWDEPHFYAALWRGDLSGAWACRCEHCAGMFRTVPGTRCRREFTPEVKAFREAALLDVLSELCRYGREKGMRNCLCLIPTDVSAHGFPELEQRLRRALEKRLVDAPAGRGSGADARRCRATSKRLRRSRDLDIFGHDPYWYLFGTDAEAFMRTYSTLLRMRHESADSELQLWLQAFSLPAGREEELRTGVRVAEEVGATHLAAWSFEATASMSKIRCPDPELTWGILGEEFRRVQG